jgi:hypothetical protein
MKHLYAAILVTLAVCGNAQAQLLADNTLPSETKDLNTTDLPAWQKTADLVNGHFRSSRLARLKNLSAALVAALQECNFAAVGGNAVWHGEYFSSAKGDPSFRFGLRCIFNEATGASSDLTIFANDLSPLLGSTEVNGKIFVTLRGFTGGGQNPAFEFAMPAPSGNGGDEAQKLSVKAWLVSTDSCSLPYVPVSRKEYLEDARLDLESKIEAIVAETKAKIMVRPADMQEAEKQEALNRLIGTYSGADLQAQIKMYLNNYQKDEDYLLRAIYENTATYAHTLHLVDSLLYNSTEDQLVQPAIVSSSLAGFHGFADGGVDAAMLVRFNSGYFAGDPEETAPKCLLVCWRYDPTESPGAAGIGRQLAEKLDSGDFRQLLR